jgi:hypothetical protein
MSSRPRVHVRVTPSRAHAQLARLFAALESAYPVRFDPSGTSADGATVAFASGPPDPGTLHGPSLTLIAGDDVDTGRRFGAVSFRDSGLVPRPFRNRTLTDSATPSAPIPLQLERWGEVLAACSDGPVWLGRTGLQYVAAGSPVELASDGTLREQLAQDRFMGLLPLVHFVRELVSPFQSPTPKPRACFVFDDPNLHWRSYGYFDYRKLSAHAEAHGYHVTAATIPLDQWLIHRRTVDELQRRGSRVTFAIHGNNHVREELRKVDGVETAAALAAQALRRCGALERAGVEVAAVMVPPHGVARVAALEGCLRAGFDALCADWPYWWLEERDSLSPLAGWEPLDRIGGLPVIPRTHIVGSDLDDLVFRAFLGQPLVLYGHHTDLREGLDLLADRADQVRSLGVESWASLGGIARDVVVGYRSDDTVSHTLFSRTAALTIPEGVARAEFELSGAKPPATTLRLEVCDGAGGLNVPAGEPVPVSPGEVVATVIAEASISASGNGRPVQAVVRRALTESRDRAAPWASKVLRRREALQ